MIRLTEQEIDAIAQKIASGLGGQSSASSAAVSRSFSPGPADSANGIFQTVELGPGQHSLRFEYLPRSFEVGRAVSTTSIVLVLGLLGIGHRRRHSPAATG